MNNINLIYNRDCSFFRGDIPCKPHKEEGYHCDNCPYYSPKNQIVLIIKLGAIGDVIRTTPLIPKIRSEFPNALIWWLTLTPEILPKLIDKVLPFSTESILTLRATEFDVVINLDKDYHACALTKLLSSKRKIGFTLLNGKPAPIDKNAEHKFLTGIFDDVNKINTKSYLEEIFEICGWKFNGEEYILDFDSAIQWDIPSSGMPIIGLNTGCGDRWVSRLWSIENWKKLIGLLSSNGFFPVLLGGKQEDERNRELSNTTGAYYAGYLPLQTFISLMNQCDAVVTQVTMALHIAIGLKKPVILMNNIFNPHEFELYGRGEIIQPKKECKCFFSPKCKNPDYFCMDYLEPESILKSLQKFL